MSSLKKKFTKFFSSKKIAQKNGECCSLSFCSVWKIFFISLFGIAIVVYFFFLPILREVNTATRTNGSNGGETLQGEGEKTPSRGQGGGNSETKASSLGADIFKEQFFLNGKRKGDSVSFEWTKYSSADFQSYELLRSDLYEGEGKVIFSSTEKANTKFVDQSANDDGPHYYKIFIKKQGGETVETNVVWL